MAMVYGYVRVSTDKQTVQNQRYEIKKFCKEEKLSVSEWIEETISGTKKIESRKLGELLKVVKKGDTIVCTELSRLGRGLFMIMQFLNFCMENEIKVYTIKDGYKLGGDITSKVLAFAFGISAEIERNMISSRTKESLARLKAEGATLGRPTGSGGGSRIARGREKELKKWLDLNLSIKKIAMRMNLSRYLVSKMIDDCSKKFGEDFTSAYLNNKRLVLKARYAVIAC